MFPLFARGCRRAGSWGLAAASIVSLSVLAGTAAAQDFEPRMPVPEREPDIEKIKQMYEDAWRNARNRKNVPNAVNVKKTVRAVEDGANGVLAVVIIAIGSVGLLVGLFVIRRMTLRVHTSRTSALDDPCMRAYMLALEGQKPEVGSQKTEGGNQKPTVKSDKAEVGSEKADDRKQKLGGRNLKTAVFAERG